MARPRKTKLDLTPDSLRILLQEIYNDCNAQKKRALEDLKQRKETFKAENVDEAHMLGKVNNDSLKIINSSIEKKIMLAKLQSQFMKDANMSGANEVDATISMDDVRSIREIFIKKDEEDKERKFDIE
jgi:predicted phage gp36 major capsid-like protein